MHYTRDTEFCSRVQVAETTKMVSLTTRVRSLSIDTAIRLKCDMVQTAELKRWLDGEYSNTHVVDVRKCRAGGFISNSEWIPLQDLDTNLSQLVERISSHVPSDVTSISQPNVPQRLVFVSLTGAEDFQSVVPSSAFSSGIKMYYLEGGILRYLEDFPGEDLLQDYDSSLWVRRDGALIYGPDIAFDFDSEIADPESDSF